MKNMLLYAWLLFLLGCDHSAPCEPAFFSTSTELVKNGLLTLEPKQLKIGETSYCGFDMSINLLCDFKIDPNFYPTHTFRGFIYLDAKGKLMQYIPFNSKSKSYPLFDFSTKKGESYTTTWIGDFFQTKTKQTVVKNIPCQVTLHDKFTVLDSTTQKIDTIYSFHFKHLKLVTNEYDEEELVLLTSIRRGIVGMYHSLRGEDYEGIFCWRGNIHRERLDSTKVDFLKNLFLE